MAGKEKNCKWYFANQPNGQEIGPNNAMEQNFRQHPYASLIRESIQNSLDAVLDKSKPVLMKFSFNEIDAHEYPEFFSVQNHIKGCLEYYPNNHNAKVVYEPMLKLFENNEFCEKLGFIRVSDYNTKGMDYDENKTDSPFYAFVRSAGVSAKENNSAGGSFGFGKAAYFLLSPISTIIVSTCTENNDKFFEGISSLCTHLFMGVKKMSVGYYDDNNGKPIQNESNIPAKFRRCEPGTDINILGFNLKYKEEAITEMKEAVLRNFWLAIYNNKLIVDIEDFIINKDNISAIMESIFPEVHDKTKKSSFYNPRPYFDAVRYSNCLKGYVAFEADLPLLGHVFLYINKQKDATDKLIFMRALQMVVHSRKNKTNYGLYGVFFCDSDKGNNILRNLENPAHDEWVANNWKVNGHTYGVGRSALQEMDDFISQSLSDSFSMKDKTAINIKGLEEFLYIPTMCDDDDDLDSESLTGNPTGLFQNEGNSITTDIPKENPTILKPQSNTSTGHVIINKSSIASPTNDGNLRSGHSNQKRCSKKEGILRPGDRKEENQESEIGKSGLFSTALDIPYRTFSQVEEGQVYHYVCLHSEEDLYNVQLHFYSVGEESDDELFVVDSNEGIIVNNKIENLNIKNGRLRLRVKFSDNLKHTLKLSIEEAYEI